ncbi:MAG: hypothetical protein ACOYD4_12000 [Solirubrobacterales bacterium]
MRERLNENPIAQLALIGVLLVVGVIVLLKPTGESEAGEESSAGEVTATVNGATATGATPGEAVEGAVESLEEGAASAGARAAGAVPASVPAPPPPAPLTAAYDAGKTVVLLVVHDGGIDDALTEAAAAGLESMPNVALFVVPAAKVARYAAVTIGLDVSQVPALVVMRPKRLSHGIPQATVQYGFQTPQSIVQAVHDAAYKGPEAAYHPG